MLRCAVLGHPIAHSLSPVLHRAAYAELGLDWTYESHDVTEDALPAFLASLGEEWRGLSLTMPLKRTVLPLLDELTPVCTAVGGANTVVLQDGRRLGDNTDVPGARNALRERYTGSVDRAVVLGGGATAASLLFALADLGCTSAVLAVRNPDRADETLEAVGRHPSPPAITVRRLNEPLPACDVLVSTVPAEAQVGGLLELEASAVFEVIYHPWPTPLARAALGSGVPLVGGLDLLVHQAVLQVELMTGLPGPLAAMRLAGEAALASR